MYCKLRDCNSFVIIKVQKTFGEIRYALVRGGNLDGKLRAMQL